MHRRSGLAALRNQRLMWADAESVPLPVLTSALPATMSALGGSLTLVGTGFLKLRRFVLGTMVCDVTVTDDENAVATVPVQSVESARVYLDTRGGQAANHPLITFTPDLVSLAPASTSAAGGAAIVLTGAGFSNVTDVKVDGISVVFVVNSNTQITITTAAHAAGVVSVEVIAPAGSDTLAASLTFA